MNTPNMLRSAALALMSLTVIIACDNRGVTAMKARMYTPEERAQARALRLTGRGSTADVPAGQTVAGPTAPTAAPTPGKPNTTDPDDAGKQHDQPSTKIYSEPINAANTAAMIKVEDLKRLIAEQIGKPNKDASDRIRGITIEKILPQFGKSTIHLSAIIKFRGHLQSLYLTTDVETKQTTPDGAKDAVLGTSNVTVTNLAMIKEQDQPITTKDMLVSTICDESTGVVCTHAYLLIQIGGDGEPTGAAVFELDANMQIVRSNLGQIVDFTTAQIAAAKASVKDTPAGASAAIQPVAPAAPAAPVDAQTDAHLAMAARFEPTSFTAARDPKPAPNVGPRSFIYGTPNGLIGSSATGATTAAPAAKTTAPAATAAPAATTSTAPAAKPEAKTATPGAAAKATAAPAASAAVPTVGSHADLKAAGLQAFPTPTEVTARDGSEKDLAAPTKPASTQTWGGWLKSVFWK